jgi:poly-gamma-glutamate capsule biosynthesis protein CapA/YwtB (metallophosphatase superfamily)
MAHSRLRQLAVVASLSLLTLFPALSIHALQVVLDVPEDLLPVWQGMIAAAPFPAAVEPRARPVPPDAGVDAILLVRKDPAAPHAGPGFRWKTVKLDFRAPASFLGDDRDSAASGGTEPPVVPLESIRLPSIALAVDGLYPGQPGYPYCVETELGLRSRDPLLVSWFESVPEAARPPIVWIGAVGDVMPARGVDRLLLSRGPVAVFGDTLPILGGCDLLFGNLEAAATLAGSPEKKSYTFRFDPAALATLKEAGFSGLSVANNHSFDYGVRGFLDTLNAIRASGIAACGGGNDFGEAAAPVELSRGGLKVRILAFADYPREAGGFDGRKVTAAERDKPGVMWLDENALGEASRAFSRDAFNVALVHGGVEYSPEPTEEQRLLYRGLIDSGADLVIGSHPHVLQGLETRGGGLIAYSLGNFIFPGMQEMPGATASVILLAGVYEGRIRYVRYIPVRLRGQGVRVDPTGGPALGLRESSAKPASSP